MNVTDLRTKSAAELQTELASARQNLAESYRLRAMNELSNGSIIRKQRRTIAHIMTVMNEQAAATTTESQGKEA